MILMKIYKSLKILRYNQKVYLLNLLIFEGSNEVVCNQLKKLLKSLIENIPLEELEQAFEYLYPLKYTIKEKD